MGELAFGETWLPTPAGEAAEPAGRSARGRGRGAPAGRKIASEACVFSCWRWWRTLIARRRAISAHPGYAGMGPRSAVIAITSLWCAAWLSGLASWVGRRCAAAMSRRWRRGGYSGAPRADPGHGRAGGGQAGWRTPLPAHARPRGSRSPAAAGEEVIADRRESGREDQPRGQHQEVGDGHPASLT